MLLPVATVTVLFRPVIVEAHNVQALVAAMEGTFLLVLVLVRLKSIFKSVRTFSSHPYVASALLYTFLFVIAFSAIGNLGILARERVQLLPMFLVLLAAGHVARSVTRGVGRTPRLEIAAHG